MKRIIGAALLGLMSTIAFGQTISVSGTVTDQQGKPIAFAFIKDAENNYATFSAPDGSFTVDANPASRLLATCNNYKEAIVKVEPAVKIVMLAGAQSLATANKHSDPFNIEEVGTDRSARPLAHFGTQQEQLHGSPFLFPDWVHGYAISPVDSIKENDDYLFNYQKLSGALLYTDDGKTMSQANKGQVKGFVLFDENAQQYTFEDVPAIDTKHYVQVLVSGSKYKIYKQLNTKFLKADFQTNGITSSGNNYDSYVDDAAYYIVKSGGQPQKVSLKKKSLKTAFVADADKFNAYMTAHDSDEIDDNFLKGLGAAMNE